MAAASSDALQVQTLVTNEDVGRCVTWIHEVKEDDAIIFRAGRIGGRLIAEWPGLATLGCAHDGSDVTFRAAAGVPRSVVAKLRSGVVKALLRDLGGGLSLHASAVAFGGRAVLFIGESGAGKSTAAAEMCRTHGAQLLADDVASLEAGGVGVSVLPSEGDHWLTRDSCATLGIAVRGERSAAHKRGIRAKNIARKPCALAMGIALRFDPSATAATFRPLRGGEAARLLLEAAIRFDVEDGAARGRELGQVTAVYRDVPFLQLVRRPDLPGSIAAIVFKALQETLQMDPRS